MAYNILHIADPHFGHCHFSDIDPRKAGQAQARELELQLERYKLPLKFDALILSGDFTFGCGDEGFDAAVAFVEGIAHLVREDGILVVPGNHDIQLGQPLVIKKLSLPTPKEDAEKRFRQRFLKPLEKYLGPPNDLLSMVRRIQLPREERGIVILGLNSCRVERRDAQGFGYVGMDQIYEACRLLLHSPSGRPEAQSGDLVLAVTHHNPLPIWDIGLEALVRSPVDRKFSFMMDAASVLDILANLGIGVLLHGHTHKRSAKRVTGYGAGLAGTNRSLLALGSGSLGILNQKSDPSHHFQILQANGTGLLDTSLTALSRPQNSSREWVLMGSVAHPLFMVWKPDEVEKALDQLAHVSETASELMAISQSWAQLRAHEEGGWIQTKASIVQRTLELFTGAKSVRVESLLENIFEDPPPESILCNVRLEQYLASQLGRG